MHNIELVTNKSGKVWLNLLSTSLTVSVKLLQTKYAKKIYRATVAELCNVCPALKDCRDFKTGACRWLQVDGFVSHP